jgi:hypothetical protein
MLAELHIKRQSKPIGGLQGFATNQRLTPTELRGQVRRRDGFSTQVRSIGVASPFVK